MCVSENREHPIVPNGFADQTIPITNGKFIGNIPYFQTNPYGALMIGFMIGNSSN